MIVRDACPGCGSPQCKKNGHIHSGKQNYQCKVCGRQFVISTEERVISSEQRTLIEHLLCERISLRGICRAVGVSLTWLLHFMIERCAACPDHLHAQLPVNPTDVAPRRLEAEADEMWNFVKKKAHKQWIWIAMDAKTRQIIALHVGDRSSDSAKQVWANIPMGCREQARFHTDQYEAHQGGFHQPSTKPSRSTPGKPITSSASITRRGSASLAWCAKPCRFPKSWPTISVPASISYATTISQRLQHYLCSTTLSRPQF